MINPLSYPIGKDNTQKLILYFQISVNNYGK